MLIAWQWKLENYENLCANGSWQIYDGVLDGVVVVECREHSTKYRNFRNLKTLLMWSFENSCREEKFKTSAKRADISQPFSKKAGEFLWDANQVSSRFLRQNNWTIYFTVYWEIHCNRKTDCYLKGTHQVLHRSSELWGRSGIFMDVQTTEKIMQILEKFCERRNPGITRKPSGGAWRTPIISLGISHNFPSNNFREVQKSSMGRS